MLHGKKLVCVLPAYNAEKTLERTICGVPEGIVDLFILVDDRSHDRTVEIASSLKDRFPIQVIQHATNLGYGGNQKTCYRAALEAGADVVVMLHPDYQYEPRLLGALAGMVALDVYDVALGSRILGGKALQGGMPLYKYIANRFLTLVENLLIGQKLSEYHSGYRAYSRRTLQNLDLSQHSNDFIFDNQILVQIHSLGFRIGEISVPTRYFKEASSINFWRSVRYGLGVLQCSLDGFSLRIQKFSGPSAVNTNPDSPADSVI